MDTWEHWFRDSAATGAIAGVATTCVIAGAGCAETGSAPAPLNAVSHILSAIALPLTTKRR